MEEKKFNNKELAFIKQVNNERRYGTNNIFLEEIYKTLTNSKNILPIENDDDIISKMYSIDEFSNMTADDLAKLFYLLIYGYKC